MPVDSADHHNPHYSGVEDYHEGLPLPPQEEDSFFGSAGLIPESAPVSREQKSATTIVQKQTEKRPTSGPYRVLARKYRPQNFDDLIGQETLVRILRRAFETGRVAHAFMLTGVRGIGKTTTARIIARALNCVGVDGTAGPTAEPCGVCPNCTAILADRHPDVLEMDAASRTGVDDIREIIEATQYRPVQGRMKVFIIDEVHMLSRNAFNALLKTLEEPPEQISFVFATTEIRKVPVTVLSRCQNFNLQRVPQDLLVSHFERIAHKEDAVFDKEAMAMIARAADGSVRDGLSLLDQAIAQGAQDARTVAHMLGMAGREFVFDLLEAVMEGRAAAALEVTERAYNAGSDLSVLLSDVMEAVHLLTRLKMIPALREGLELSEIERLRGGALADRLSMGVLGRAWQILLKGLGEITNAPNQRQAVEMVLIRLCYTSLLPTPDKIISALGSAQSPASVPALPVQPGAASERPGTGRDADHVRTGTNPSSPAISAAVTPELSSGSVIRQEGSVGTTGHGGSVVQIPDGAGSLRLVANGGVYIEPDVQPLGDIPAVPEDTQSVPMPRTWREFVTLVQKEQPGWLHGILRLEAHPVQFSPPLLRMRIDDPSVRRRAFREVSSLLERLYPGQWQLESSTEQGEPSLDQQGEKVVALRRHEAENHPLVKAIIEKFPGARLGEVRDLSLDHYGLPPEEVFIPLGGDIPSEELAALEFAPLDAGDIEETDLDSF